MRGISKKGTISDGDLTVIAVADREGRRFILASFHGDTDGLATPLALSAVHAVTASREGHTLLFGLDANCYERHTVGKQLGATEFADGFASLGYTSCWGDVPPVDNYTTYNARTFLQPQLQKASKFNEKAKKGDRNPKDYILFPKGSFSVTEASKDNTGSRSYTEDMVFPTLSFPSDHGLIACTLQPERADEATSWLHRSAAIALGVAVLASLAYYANAHR